MRLTISPDRTYLPSEQKEIESNIIDNETGRHQAISCRRMINGSWNVTRYISFRWLSPFLLHINWPHDLPLVVGLISGVSRGFCQELRPQQHLVVSVVGIVRTRPINLLGVSYSLYTLPVIRVVIQIGT